MEVCGLAVRIHPLEYRVSEEGGIISCKIVALSPGMFLLSSLRMISGVGSTRPGLVYHIAVKTSFPLADYRKSSQFLDFASRIVV